MASVFKLGQVKADDWVGGIKCLLIVTILILLFNGKYTILIL